MSGSANGIKLSILVPAYNMERYLAQCLNSILSQQVNFQYQILVADDCSTDNTKQVVSDFEKRFPAVIKAFYNNPNLGPSGNLCNLIEHVDTELFIQIDGDDYITDTSKLQLQVNVMDANPACSICFHNYAVVDSDSNITSINSYPFKGDLILPEDYVAHKDLGPGNLVMIRRKALPALLPAWIRNSGYHVDYMVHSVAATEGRIYYLDRILTAYRKHAANVTLVTQKERVLKMLIANPISLVAFYKSKGLKKEEAALAGMLPRRYTELAYFYLSTGKPFQFIRFFIKGFMLRPNFTLKNHKDMMYFAAPDFAAKLKKRFSWL